MQVDGYRKFAFAFAESILLYRDLRHLAGRKNARPFYGKLLSAAENGNACVSVHRARAEHERHIRLWALGEHLRHKRGNAVPGDEGNAFACSPLAAEEARCHFACPRGLR